MLPSMNTTALCCLVAWIATHFLLSFLRRTQRLPPGPFPVPVVGNLLSVGERPHRSLARLARAYGPVLSLRLGSLTTVVASSVEAAREVLQKNDVALAGRHVQDAITWNAHNEVSVVFMPLGPRWRNLRKICNSHIFSTSRLDASRELRKKKVQQLVAHVEECSKAGSPVKVGLAAFSASLNLLSNTFFSVDMAADSDPDASTRLKELVLDIVNEVGKPNVVDYFPVLKWLDPQGVRPRIGALIDRIFRVFDEMIEPRLERKEDKTHKDVLDVLLGIAQESENEFSLKDIRHLLTDLFTAGTDTTSSTIEWAMAELLHNPSKLTIAQSEVDLLIGGKANDVMEESDIARLPYLQAVVKETLRLHPPTPLLIPRKATTDVDLCGYTVPKGAQVFVNVWAIGRDPAVWDSPEEFQPERFLASGIDYKGCNFKLIPFGSGRRVCPGLMLAHRVIHVVVGELIRRFDWVLPDGMKPQDLNMDDKFGLTVQKASPLLAIPIPRVLRGD